jgi:hypothetical protein
MRCDRVAGGEVIDMDLKLEAALDTRDALAKSIYAALFRCSQLTFGGAWHAAVAALIPGTGRVTGWPGAATAAGLKTWGTC